MTTRNSPSGSDFSSPSPSLPMLTGNNLMGINSRGVLVPAIQWAQEVLVCRGGCEKESKRRCADGGEWSSGQVRVRSKDLGARPQWAIVGQSGLN